LARQPRQGTALGAHPPPAPGGTPHRIRHLGVHAEVALSPRHENPPEHVHPRTGKRLSGDTAEYFSEKNRLSVGLGYVFNQTWTVELGFHREGARTTGEEDFKVSGNVIDIRFKTSVRIRDLVKGR
jgi:hypothetical protein